MILISNDDGPAKGVGILSSVARKFDKVTEIIPQHQQSAVGKSMTFHKALRLHERDYNGRKVFLLSGTPADCVCFALHSKCVLRSKPKLMLAGINAGDNASLHSIFTSGTMGACIEASIFGIPAIAFSMSMVHRDWSHPINWQYADKIEKQVENIIGKVIKEGLPKGCDILSVNFPKDLSKAKLVIAPPRRHHFNIKVIKRLDPANIPYYWVVGTGTAPGEIGDDVGQIQYKKNITLTPITLSLTTDETCNSLRTMFG